MKVLPSREHLFSPMVEEDALYACLGTLPNRRKHTFISEVQEPYRHLGNNVSHPLRQSLQRLHAGKDCEALVILVTSSGGASLTWRRVSSFNAGASLLAVDAILRLRNVAAR
tara:strand:- start:2727 stop:3062 length:336 start_codon:yes stop_codon:yes gene_type:complete